MGYVICGVGLENRTIKGIVKLSFSLSLIIILTASALGAWYLGPGYVTKTDPCYPDVIETIVFLGKSGEANNDFKDKKKKCEGDPSITTLTVAKDDGSKQAEEGYYSYRLMNQPDGEYKGGLTADLAGEKQCTFFQNAGNEPHSFCRQRPAPKDECGEVDSQVIIGEGRLQEVDKDKCKARKVPQLCKKTGILAGKTDGTDNVDVLVEDQEQAVYLGWLAIGVTILAILHLLMVVYSGLGKNKASGFCQGLEVLCCCVPDYDPEACCNYACRCFGLCNINKIEGPFKYEYEACALQFVSLICEAFVLVAGAALFDINTHIEDICFLSKDEHFNGGVTARAHIERDSDTFAAKHLQDRDNVVYVFKALYIAICITTGIKLLHSLLVGCGCGDQKDLENNLPACGNDDDKMAFGGCEDFMCGGEDADFKKDCCCCIYEKGGVSNDLRPMRPTTPRMMPRSVQLRGQF